MDKLADEITVSAPFGRVDLEAAQATKARRKRAAGGWATLTGSITRSLLFNIDRNNWGAPLLALFKKWPAAPFGVTRTC